MTKAPIVKDEPVDPAPKGTPTEGLTTGLPAEDYQTEQYKSGPGPVDPPAKVTQAVPVTVAPGEPYPTGGPEAVQGLPQNRRE